MAARLRKGQSGTKRVGQIVGREAGKALQEIGATRQPRDTAVHDARKRIKRARAALRLIREPLGQRRFRRENTALRDAARPLSEIRDAKILVEAFDALVAPSARRRNNGLHRLREMLMAIRPGDALRAVRKRRHHWPLGLEIMEPMAPAQIRRLGRQLHRLSDHLGDDHDLAVLKQRLVRSRGRVPRTAVRAVSRLIDERRRELRAKALRLGERLYQPRPRRFARPLRRGPFKLTRLGPEASGHEVRVTP